MFLTSYASLFALREAAWVALVADTSWMYIRLRTVISGGGEDPKLVLSFSKEKSFAAETIVLETVIMSGSKWILVADDFAEFEIDKQRYGAYFENDKTASTFTGAIAEALQELRAGTFDPTKENERIIDRHTGALKSRNNSESGEVTKAKKNKSSRRKSLAKFDEVNEAIEIAASRITVTETLDLGQTIKDHQSDGGGDGTDTVVSSTSEDLDFDLAIEKQITTVYNRNSVEAACKRHGRNKSHFDDDKKSEMIQNEMPKTDEPSDDQVSGTSKPPKKNSLTLSSFTSIFRKPQKSATAEKEAEYHLNKDAPPLPDRRMLGCLPYRSDVDLEPDIENAFISAPESVLHMTSVNFNETLGRYEGLPDEWKGQNRVFGVPLESLPKRVVPGYSEPVPTVLILMKEHLLRLNAKSVVGIFRLAPDKDDCNDAKDLINLGDYDYNNCVDPNILANLLKVFFRELPQNLFNSIPEREILKIASLSSIDEIVEELENGILNQSQYSLILWLLDLMAIFVQNEHENKMSAKNMAIVVSPNLYAVNSENPMVALTMAQKVAEFTTKILAGRLKVKFNCDVAIK